MELGIGHHGEPGTSVEPLRRRPRSGATWPRRCSTITALSPGPKSPCSSPARRDADQRALHPQRAIDEEVAARLKIARTYVGNFFTSLEMVGRDADDNGARRGAQGAARRRRGVRAPL